MRRAIPSVIAGLLFAIGFALAGACWGPPARSQPPAEPRRLHPVLPVDATPNADVTVVPVPAAER